ncbi:MAG: ATP-binding protein [Bdellovibrionia bacterium]
MNSLRKIPVLIIFIGIFAIATGALYLVFDLHLKRMTEEMLIGWTKSEAVSIQEGQILSSFAKNQRLLTNSDLVRGVSLINIERNEPYVEIEFGESLSGSAIQRLKDNDENTQVISLGRFHKLGAVKIHSPQKFLVVFETKSVFFEHVFWWTVTFFGLLLLMMVYLIRRIEKKQAHYAHLASQVAHDIRSPINTLNHIASTMDLQSENNQELLKKTIERLQLIVSDLIEKRTDGFSDDAKVPERKQGNVTANADGLEHVRSLIEEKKALHSDFRGREISLHVETSQALLSASLDDLIRSLSNLLDNSLEAIGLFGKVELIIKKRNGFLDFVVKDTGPGVPEELLSQIGKPKFSFGKTNGSGMGVFKAKRLAEGSGGSFKFESKVGEGTQVTLSIPCEPGDSEIKYVVIDDDILAHSMWKHAIHAHSSRLRLDEFRFFTNAHDFESWLLANKSPLPRFFVDYDLKDKRNGLQVIRDLDLQGRSVLVTYSYDDKEIRAEAMRLGVEVRSKADLTPFVANL